MLAVERIGTSQILKEKSLGGGRSLIASRGKPRPRPADREVPFGGATCTRVRTSHGTQVGVTPHNGPLASSLSYTLAIRKASFYSVDESDSRRYSAAFDPRTSRYGCGDWPRCCSRVNTFYPLQVENLTGTPARFTFGRGRATQGPPT